MAAARRRAGAGGEPENRERWLLTYADLITLLLAFFIIMYAISSPEVAKYLLLKGSLQQAFNQGVLEGEVNASILASGALTVEGEIPDLSNPVAPQVQSQVQALEDQKVLFRQVIQSVGPRQEGLAISLSGTLAFVSGSSELTPEGIVVLSDLADILRPLSQDLRIEGHTDTIPTGSIRFPTNWELSAARAVTIARFFEAAGVPPYRLSAFGYGEQRPIASNATADGRRLNRRAEIVLVEPGTKLFPSLSETFATSPSPQQARDQ